MRLTEVNHLFLRYYEKTASPEEVETLMSWIADPANKEALTRLMRERWEALEPGVSLFSAEKSQAILDSLMASSTGMESREEAPIRVVRLWPRVAVVAAIGLLLCAGLFLLTRQPATKETPPIVQQAPPQDVQPGGKKAVLTLANGSTIELDSAGKGLLAQQGNTTVNKLAEGQLSYASATGASGAIGYNMVSTPRGGEYQVVLPDGSKVWLNAASSLRFPTAFTGATRAVELNGEAYFEIVADKSKPFYVQTKTVKVEVLGTHFDVMAYEDEPICKTSLLEGRVKVAKDNEVVSLSPAEGAVLNIKDGRLKVSNTNVDQDVAWKEGNFDFENEDIYTIMRQLSRWYDIKVVFSGNFDVLQFTGGIRRQVAISQVLHMLELAGGVGFRIDGNTVTVERKI